MKCVISALKNFSCSKCCSRLKCIVVQVYLTGLGEHIVTWHTSPWNLWECVMFWSKHLGQCYHINANAISVYCYLCSGLVLILKEHRYRGMNWYVYLEQTDLSFLEHIKRLASPCLLTLVVVKLSHLCYCLEILSSSLFKQRGQHIPVLFLLFSLHPEHLRNVGFVLDFI